MKNLKYFKIIKTRIFSRMGACIAEEVGGNSGGNPGESSNAEYKRKYAEFKA